MNCEEFRERLDEYLDAMADESLQARMDTHAQECAACAEILKQTMDIKFALGELEDDITPPAAVSAAWKRAVRLEAERRRRKDVRRGWRTFAAIAAALTVWIGATAVMEENGLLPLVIRDPEMGAEPAMVRYIGEDASAKTEAASGDSAVYLASDGETNDTVFTTGTAERAMTVSEPVQVMRVKSVKSEIVTEDLDVALANLDDLVSEMDGYYEFETETEEEGVRAALLTIRVPADSLDAFMAEFRSLGIEADGEYHEDDVAADYYDIDARLDLLNTQKEQYASLIAQASDAAEIETLANNAEAVQEQIDALEGQKREWNASLQYASVQARLSTEPVHEATLGERMAAAWNSALDFAKDMLVSLAYLAPFILIVCAIAAIVVVVKKKKKNQ